MKLLSLVAASAALFFLSAAAQAKPLLASQLPVRADAPILFAPRGWGIEKRVSGDLNRDSVPDAALVLVESKPARDDANNPAPRARALVVLLREGKGWKRAGFNSSLLLGTRDGGAFYGVVETPVNVSIARGVLLVNQDNGSRQTTETTHKFRFDAPAKRFYLIGSEKIDNDRLEPYTRSESTNFLTGVRKVTLIRGETERETTKTSRVSRKLRPLESVRVEERYSG